MKKVIILICMTILFLSLSTFSQEYYYSNEQQIPLYVDSSKVLILFDNVGQFNSEQFVSDYQRIDSLETRIAQDMFRIADINSGTNLDDFIDSLLIDYRVALVNPYYINAKDSSVMVGRTICCKFADNVSYDFIDSLNNEYDVEIVEQDPNAVNLYLLGVLDDAEYSTLEIANIYYQLDETDFSHPNFLGGFEWHSYYIYDHYWEEQWAMHRIFRGYNGSPDSLNHRALEITAGDTSITIAVLDMGVGPHEDLPAERVINGYDFANMDNDASPCNLPDFGSTGHGQGVGGIITASQNRDPDSLSNPDTGIYGIAPNCKVMSVKMGNGLYWNVDNPNDTDVYIPYPSCRGVAFADDWYLAGAVSWAWTHGADIIGISWGNITPYDNLHFSLQQAASLGRDEKGCGIFVSSGNSSNHTYYPALI